MMIRKNNPLFMEKLDEQKRQHGFLPLIFTSSLRSSVMKTMWIYMTSVTKATVSSSLTVLSANYMSDDDKAEVS